MARVVAAMEDPNPQVAGSGLQRLRDAGIQVDTGLQEADARALNPGFVLRMSQGRPLIRIKAAASLDGRTAMASGCLLYTSPSPRDGLLSRMPSSA